MMVMKEMNGKKMWKSKEKKREKSNKIVLTKNGRKKTERKCFFSKTKEKRNLVDKTKIYYFDLFDGLPFSFNSIRFFFASFFVFVFAAGYIFVARVPNNNISTHKHIEQKHIIYFNVKPLRRITKGKYQESNDRSEWKRTKHHNQKFEKKQKEEFRFPVNVSRHRKIQRLAALDFDWHFFHQKISKTKSIRFF